MNSDDSFVTSSLNSIIASKLLSGKLVEEVYLHKNDNINLDHTNIININNINNRSGNEILHKIINLENISVSLHLYFPPKFKQNIFNI